MKNTIKFFGIIALAVIIGFSMAGCDNPAGGDNTGDNTPPVTNPGGDDTPRTPGDPVAVSGVTLNKTTLNLIAGTNETLTATVAPANATNKGLTWESSNTATATVSNGTVTAVAAGSTTITVKTTDGEKTATCAVTVYPAPDSIAITTPLTKNWCVVGDTSLDLTGMVVTATHSEGTYTVPHDMLTVTGFNPAIAGTNNITISYGGKSADSFTVTVVSITNISVSTIGTIRVALNEPLNSSVLEKITVTATYSDGKGTENVSDRITLANISGFSSSPTGVKILTVNYRGVTSNTFTVTVVEVDGISIATYPAKTRYAIGESIDLTGLTITVNYSDSSMASATPTIANISGFSSATATPSQTVTVTYSGHTTSFVIKVYATVTFNPNGGNWSGSTANQTVQTEGDTAVTPPADPTPYDAIPFDGWYTQASGGEKVNFATLINTNKTFYAQYAIPTLSGEVSISGTAKVGQTLTADISALLGKNGTPSYQWKRGVTDIGTDSTYVVQVADEGSSITLTVTYSGSIGSGVESNPINVTAYVIGDAGPGGGKIFYVKAVYSDGWKYLEAAPSELSGTYRWATNGYQTTGIDAVHYKYQIGDGKACTQAIIAAIGSANAPAAKACVDYRGGGLSDWFLPSIYELKEVYTQRNYAGGYTRTCWGSSQNGTNYAQIFQANGLDAGMLKSDSTYVRPIRQF